MIFENYCKPGGVELLGIKGAFDEEIDRELKPCLLCGRLPKPMVRVDSLDGYFATVSCFGCSGRWQESPAFRRGECQDTTDRVCDIVKEEQPKGFNL